MDPLTFISVTLAVWIGVTAAGITLAIIDSYMED